MRPSIRTASGRRVTQSGAGDGGMAAPAGGAADRVVALAAKHEIDFLPPPDA